MITRDIDGTRWYVVAAHYGSKEQAKRAWERIQAQMMPGPDTGLGVVRLAPHPKQGDPKLMTLGAPPGRHVVVANTYNNITATGVEMLLRGGTVFDVKPDFADALIARSTQMRDEHTGGPLRVVRRRHEDAGAEIDAAGNVHEPEGDDDGQA
ncbi:MAG TPA: hypothetical protein VGG82_07865 [Casimicrobiaceae bacterium]|jgi:hypothetical protein